MDKNTVIVEEGKRYPKEQLPEVVAWWEQHREYDIDEEQDYVTVKLRPHWQEEQIDRLREERQRVCFPIINRGSLWYKRLTPEQTEELEVWYQAWLDVTDTKVKPEMPLFLQETNQEEQDEEESKQAE